MKVAVLGCGPSGLVAAHAAALGGNQVVVLSRKVPSPIYGAQYLHKSIPGTPPQEPTLIQYRMQGTPENYLRKVYGQAWDGTISDDLRDQEHLAWDIRSTYDWLWGEYEDLILNTEFSSLNFGLFYSSLFNEFDLVINTLPRPVLCKGMHDFKHTTIYAIGDAPGQKVDFPIDDGDIIYNGEEAPSWYRLANVHGFKTVEWPYGSRPPMPEVALARKPLRHNCDCWPKLMHAGRFGRWQNGKLVHETYWDVYEALAIANMKEKVR